MRPVCILLREQPSQAIPGASDVGTAGYCGTIKTR